MTQVATTVPNIGELNSQSDPELRNALQAIVNIVNGQLSTDNVVVAFAKDVIEPAFSGFQYVRCHSGPLDSALVSGITYFMAFGGPQRTNQQVGLGSIFYLDPADMVAGARAVKARIKTTYITNGTQSGKTITIGFWPVTGLDLGGAQPPEPTLGTEMSGLTVAYADPAINQMLAQNTNEFTIASAGYYGMGFTIDAGAAWALGAKHELDLQLQVRRI